MEVESLVGLSLLLTIWLGFCLLFYPLFTKYFVQGFISKILCKTCWMHLKKNRVWKRVYCLGVQYFTCDPEAGQGSHMFPGEGVFQKALWCRIPISKTKNWCNEAAFPKQKEKKLVKRITSMNSELVGGNTLAHIFKLKIIFPIFKKNVSLSVRTVQLPKDLRDGVNSVLGEDEDIPCFRIHCQCL